MPTTYSPRYRPGLESLENRVTPAGDFAAAPHVELQPLEAGGPSVVAVVLPTAIIQAADLLTAESSSTIDLAGREPRGPGFLLFAPESTQPPSREPLPGEENDESSDWSSSSQDESLGADVIGLLFGSLTATFLPWLILQRR